MKEGNLNIVLFDKWQLMYPELAILKGLTKTWFWLIDRSAQRSGLWLFGLINKM